MTYGAVVTLEPNNKGGHFAPPYGYARLKIPICNQFSGAWSINSMNSSSFGVMMICVRRLR